MSDDASVVRARAAKVFEAGASLRRSTIEQRASWLAAAADRLTRRTDESSPELSESTGLSVPMIRWAAATTLDTVRVHAMLDLWRRARSDAGPNAEPIAMLAVVLAGNVFTASVRGVMVPLLCGIPVLVKTSSKETQFPAMLREALRDADAHLGASMDVVTFAGGDVDCEDALLEPAEALSVYGSDETLASLGTRLGKTPLLAHGHGVSVAYCAADALESGTIGQTIERLSLDIAAYDQRGCLSPQLVYVEEDPRMAITEFARRLASEGLDPMSQRLPRGALPLSVGAAQAQWRGIAEVEGTLFVGNSFSVAVRPTNPLRWSPAYRNVTLSPVAGVNEALRAMEPIGSNLKCVGADASSLAQLSAGLAESRSLQAYACALGEMQTPPLDAAADGRPIWYGLFRS
jgi:acyl-CoA reductase-like NAD-dependent aldehyde dehydrogenase